MKHGWEYKLLGEVSEIVGGSTPKTSIDSYWGGEYPWVTPAELNGAKYIDKTERTITDEALAHTNLQLLPVGTVLLSSRAPIGKLAITKTPMYCNQGFKNIIPGDSLYNEFAYWYLTYKKDYIISLGRGATFKEISKSITEKIPIPIPPIEEQTAICSLLDKLSLVIEKKKQQVKELDNLAQAIFYDMFGDPVENEKGWKVKSLNDVCDVRDGTHDSPKYIDGGDYILITSKNIVDGKIDYSNINYITKEDYDAINKRSKVDDGDIIMAMIGTIGKPIIVKMQEYKFCIKNVALIKFYKESTVSNIYIKALLSSSTFSQHIISKNQGGTQKFVALGTIRKLSIPIPPLSLQQSFAQKVEAIERQKELINQSIREAQTLFDSRMEYYFGE